MSVIAHQNTPNCTLFVGDLAVFADEDSLREIFSPYGDILEISIKVGNGDRRVKLGYGHIRFSTPEAAVAAKEGLHGVLHKGRALRLQWAGTRGHKNPVLAPTPSASQVLVSFISRKADYLVSEESLRAVFGRFGIVVDATIKKTSIDPDTLFQGGYGFVHFEDNEHGIESALSIINIMSQNYEIENVAYQCQMSDTLRRKINGEPPRPGPGQRYDGPDSVRYQKMKQTHLDQQAAGAKLKGQIPRSILQESVAALAQKGKLTLGSAAGSMAAPESDPRYQSYAQQYQQPYPGAATARPPPPAASYSSPPGYHQQQHEGYGGHYGGPGHYPPAPGPEGYDRGPPARAPYPPAGNQHYPHGYPPQPHGHGHYSPHYAPPPHAPPPPSQYPNYYDGRPRAPYPPAGPAGAASHYPPHPGSGTEVYGRYPGDPAASYRDPHHPHNPYHQHSQQHSQQYSHYPGEYKQHPAYPPPGPAGYPPPGPAGGYGARIPHPGAAATATAASHSEGYYYPGAAGAGVRGKATTLQLNPDSREYRYPGFEAERNRDSSSYYSGGAASAAAARPSPQSLPYGSPSYQHDHPARMDKQQHQQEALPHRSDSAAESLPASYRIISPPNTTNGSGSNNSPESPALAGPVCPPPAVASNNNNSSSNNNNYNPNNNDVVDDPMADLFQPRCNPPGASGGLSQDTVGSSYNDSSTAASAQTEFATNTSTVGSSGKYIAAHSAPSAVGAVGEEDGDSALIDSLLSMSLSTSQQQQQQSRSMPLWMSSATMASDSTVPATADSAAVVTADGAAAAPAVQ